MLICLSCLDHTITAFHQIITILQFLKLNVLWALQDSTVILSCGPHIYTLKVDQSLPSLESLCRHAIMSMIASDGEDVRINLLPLPTQEISRLTKIKEPLMTVIK